MQNSNRSAKPILRGGSTKAAALYDAKDVDGLLTLMKEAHLFVKVEAALCLGRLGARSALADLTRLDAQLSRFACRESGEFGVAVILIENESEEAERAALLAVATADPKESKLAHSVIDKAAEELARYTGEEIVRRVRRHLRRPVHRARPSLPSPEGGRSARPLHRPARDIRDSHSRLGGGTRARLARGEGDSVRACAPRAHREADFAG